jgi:hypothetical protein
MSHGVAFARRMPRAYDAQMLRYVRKRLMAGVGADVRACRSLYLDLMQACLQGRIYEDPSIFPAGEVFDPAKRDLGLDIPKHAHTMIGNQRLTNLRVLAEYVVTHDIPGDFIETGVWRGGACILMRAILKAYGVADRRVWVADSFQGLPPPDVAHYPADKGSNFHVLRELAVTAQQVKANFAKYGLLDSQVEFLPGWFKDTLPAAPVERLALLRLDGDMYESTIVALDALYHKLSPGGFAIIDDYHDVPACRAAVTDYRSRNAIQDAICEIDGTGVFWQKVA